MKEHLKSHPRTEDEAKELALFRFSLIAPLINNNEDYASNNEYAREKASKELTLPSGKKVYYTPKTILAWYYDYKRNGFDALLPKIRCDFGHSRKLDDNTKDKIIEYKRKISAYHWKGYLY